MVVSYHHDGNSWLINFGATCHITITKELLKDTLLIRAQIVIFRDNVTFDTTKIDRAPIVLQNFII